MNVEVHGVQVRYGAVTLGPFELQAGPGVHRITGPNGVGKSTLMGVLSGALLRTAGDVKLDGLDPARSPLVRARTGYVPSAPLLPDALTVREAWQLAAALRRSRSTGEALCERLKLPAHVRLGHCSAGMRKKAEWVAALVADPDLLLLDEPFEHVDAESRPILVDAMCRPGRTVILVHHGALPFDLPVLEHPVASV